MMRIVFNKSGYDPFIDFLKCFSILAVVFCHGFPFLSEIGYPIWGMQIPIFLLIQVFHCYKRDRYKIKWDTIIKRILLPFILVELFIFIALLCVGNDDCKDLIIKGIKAGGYGPGAYYPWIYLQMAIMIPIMRPMIDRFGKWKSLLIFILISESLEIICSVIHIPDSLYRLLFFRYFFLIYLGWIWARDGIILNFSSVVFSLLSLCALIFFGYFGGNFEPLFYDTDWLTHRWPCYCWAAILFCGLLYQLFRPLAKSELICEGIKVLAAASYEVFLVQMAYFSIFLPKYLFFICNPKLQYFVWFILAFVVSIWGGILLFKIRKCIFVKH